MLQLHITAHCAPELSSDIFEICLSWTFPSNYLFTWTYELQGCEHLPQTTLPLTSFCCYHCLFCHSAYDTPYNCHSSSPRIPLQQGKSTWCPPDYVEFQLPSAQQIVNEDLSWESNYHYHLKGHMFHISLFMRLRWKGTLVFHDNWIDAPEFLTMHWCSVACQSPLKAGALPHQIYQCGNQVSVFSIREISPCVLRYFKKVIKQPKKRRF